MANYLTDKQKRILMYIADYINKFGYSPSIRNIKEALGIRNIKGVTVHLDALERKKYISRNNSHRSIQILNMPNLNNTEFTSIPLIGTIAAGLPLLAVENIESRISIPSSMLGMADEAFLLRVRGDSMIDAHILPDDLVLIRPQHNADNGDLVAALLDDEATVKRLHVDEDEILLMPANPLYSPIQIKGTNIRIIGKVIGLIRSY